MDDVKTLPPRPRDVAVEAARQAWATERLKIERGRHRVSPNGRYSRWRSRAFGAAADGFAWGVRLVGLRRRGLNNALAPLLVELELRFAKLPAAFDGYRILHLSDTHLDALPELAPIAAQLLDGLVVDLLVVTGDILAKSHAAPERATGPLALAVSGVRARDGRLAVLGNHDPATMADALDAAGFEVLLNRSAAIDRQGDRILVIGLDDVHAFYTEAARRALADDAAPFRIALVHSAEMADHAGAAGIALYLCGHTHGGQVCLPGGRMLISRLKRCHHGARGLWRDGEMIGYTSCGLGVAGQNFRFNCPGEATLITLRRER